MRIQKEVIITPSLKNTEKNSRTDKLRKTAQYSGRLVAQKKDLKYITDVINDYKRSINKIKVVLLQSTPLCIFAYKILLKSPMYKL